MKNPTSKTLLSFLMILITGQILLAQPSIEELKEELEEYHQKSIKAQLEGDLEAEIEDWADDIIVMPNFFPVINGKEAFIKHAKANKREGQKINSVTYTTIDVWTCHNLVYEIGHYANSVTVPELPHPIADIGKYLVIRERQSDKSLKIKLLIWNTDLSFEALLEMIK